MASTDISPQIEIIDATPEYIAQMVDLHRQRLSAQRSVEALTYYYEFLLRSREAVCVCAVVGSRLAGFACALQNRFRLTWALATRMPFHLAMREMGEAGARALIAPLLKQGKMRVRRLRGIPEHELRPIVVSAEFARGGVGERLLRAVRERLLQRGYSSMFLRVHVRNEDAYRFYLAKGFQLLTTEDHDFILLKRFESESASSNDATEGHCSICLSKGEVVLTNTKQSLYECKSCQLWWLSPSSTQQELAEYFDSTMPLDPKESVARFVHNRHRNLGLVATFVKRWARGGRILDIGCGTGYFMRQFFVGDSRWEPFAIDLASEGVRQAREGGINASVGTIESVQFEEKTFDAVTILDTFYYFPTPRRDLSQIMRLLKVGGILVIEMPSARPRLWRTVSRFGRWITGTRRPPLRTDHMFFYSPQAINILLRTSGFQVIGMYTLPANRHPDPMMRALYGIYGLITWVVERLTLWRLDFSPRFVIVARRPV